MIGGYIHHNSKIGALVEIETSGSAADALKDVASGIAMHVTAINPISVDRDAIDPDVIAKEKEIAAEQVKNKPVEIIEKIVEGKIGKFLKDNCLVNQAYVKDDGVTVEEALAKAAKDAGVEAKIKRFTRFEIG